MKLKYFFTGRQYEKELSKKIELVRSSDLFDENWYYDVNPDVLVAHKDAARHYFISGWKEGRDPSDKFSNDVYLREHPECSVCPLYDYEQKKIGESYRGKIKNMSNYDLIAQSTYFNKDYYLKHCPNLKKRGKDPIKHYLKYGWKMGLNPSAKFDTKFYLDRNQDVKKEGINPLIHFIKYGRFEDRIPKESNSIKKWLYSISNIKYKNKSLDYILIARSKYFDAAWYLNEYSEVAKSGIDPVEHYLNIGWKEGKNPSPLFDATKYLSMYVTAKDSLISPLLYHEKYGKDAGFIACPINVVFPKDAENFTYEKRIKNNEKYKKLAVFASFSADGKISEHVVFYLKELRKICDGIVFVTDNPLFSDELDKIKKYIIAAIVKRHEEYDFGSYKRGICWLAEKNILSKKNLLILCNDSCFGPIYPLRKMMETMKTRNCDFWGITKNIEYGEHIQSYFMCFKSQVFMSESFKTFFLSVHHWESQKEVVQNYEVPLTSYLYDNGFTYDTYISYPEDKKSYPRNISSNLTRIGEYLIKSQSPFIKIKYFCSPKWNLDSRKNTVNLIKDINVEVYNLILKHSNVIIDEQEETEKKKRILICNLININRIAPDKLVILARCNVNSSGINLFLNGVKLPKNKDLNANMKYLLEKNDARFCFWEIDEKLLNKWQNKIIAMYKEKIELKIDRNMLADTRLLNRENKFVRVVNNTCYLEKKYFFYFMVLFSPFYTIKHKMLFLLCLFRRKKYVLFSELSGLANDNAFEIFQEYKKTNNDGFYFVGAELKNEIAKIINKKSLVVFNSLKHLWLLINAKKIICSYGIYSFLHQNLIDVHYALLDFDLIYDWHGISCDDKDSVIYRYLYGTPDLCCCCSEYEKEFFENKCEYPLVKVTGAPRMDKWKKYTINNKQILIFLTWRRTIKNYHDLVTSDYLHEVKKILECLRNEKYQKYEIVYCIYHHFYQKYRSFLVDMIHKINPNVKIISNVENKKFNKYFATSKFFITDCSSAIYDKGYQNDSITICYLPDNFTTGHFALNENFYNRQLGYIVHNTSELEKALELKEKTKEMKLRQKTFFKYFDNGNSKRVSLMIQEFNNNSYNHSNYYKM